MYDEVAARVRIPRDGTKNFLIGIGLIKAQRKVLAYDLKSCETSLSQPC